MHGYLLIVPSPRVQTIAAALGYRAVHVAGDAGTSALLQCLRESGAQW